MYLKVLRKEYEGWTPQERVDVLTLICNLVLASNKFRVYMDEIIEEHEAKRRELWNIRNERRKRLKAVKDGDKAKEKMDKELSALPAHLKRKKLAEIKAAEAKAAEQKHTRANTKPLTEEELAAKEKEKEDSLGENMVVCENLLRWNSWGVDRAKRRYFVYDPQNASTSGLLISETPPTNQPVWSLHPGPKKKDEKKEEVNRSRCHLNLLLIAVPYAIVMCTIPITHCHVHHTYHQLPHHGFGPKKSAEEATPMDVEEAGAATGEVQHLSLTL